MKVRVVLCVVLVVVVVVTDAKDALQVKKEVEDIFKTVETIMAARSAVKKPPTTAKPIVSEARSNLKTSESSTAAGTVVDRSFIKPVSTFPVGVIVSDNLYPLVVGKNAQTGQPFVMNMEKQHAMVVARGAADGGYRLVIPFPVMVGSQRFGDYEEEDPPSLPMYRTPLPSTGYRYPSSLTSYPSQYRYSSGSEGRSNFDEDENVEDTPATVHGKYAQNHRYEDDPPYLDEARHQKYPTKIPKKYTSSAPLYGHARHKPIESFDSYSTDPPSKLRPSYLTNPQKQLSYYVEGPKYIPRTVIPIALRHSGALNYRMNGLKSYPLASPKRVVQYRNSLNDPSASSYPVKYSSSYAGVPKDFRPSPYLGSIVESRDSSDKRGEKISGVDGVGGGGLEPQSEVFDSYDDRGDEMNTEKDFDDSSPDKAEGEDRHTSSGGVRHVTYHVDDYLGKIYEEMYYQLPSTERIDTDSGSTSGTIDSRAPQVFPVQDYQTESGSGFSVTEGLERSRRSDEENHTESNAINRNKTANR